MAKIRIKYQLLYSHSCVPLVIKRNRRIKDITINGSYNYTAIEEVVAEKENVDAIYNLNGLRVIDTVNLKSGIYIMNGKKVLVK